MIDRQKNDLIKYLSRVFYMTKTKQRLEREYEQKLEEMDSLSISFEEIKVTRNTSKVENIAIDLISIKNDIDLNNTKMEIVKQEIAFAIDKLEDDELKNLLRLRYIEFKKWRDIAYILRYTVRHTHRKHNKALKELFKIYNN